MKHHQSHQWTSPELNLKLMEIQGSALTVCEAWAELEDFNKWYLSDAVPAGENMLITNVDFQVSKRLLHLFTYKTQRNDGLQFSVRTRCLIKSSSWRQKNAFLGKLLPELRTSVIALVMSWTWLVVPGSLRLLLVQLKLFFFHKLKENTTNQNQ